QNASATTMGIAGNASLLPIVVGASLSNATVNGSTNAYILGTVRSADDVTVTATDTSNSTTQATAISAGLGPSPFAAVGAGADATSSTTQSVSAYVQGATLGATSTLDSLSIMSFGTPHAHADAFGVAASVGVSVGASLANATTGGAIAAHVESGTQL